MYKVFHVGGEHTVTFGYIKTPITYIDWPIEHTPDRSILTFIRAKILAERLKNGCNVTPIAARRKIESTLMFHGVGTGDMSAHAESFLSKTRSQYAWGLPTTHAYAWGPRPFNYLNLPSNLRYTPEPLTNPKTLVIRPEQSHPHRILHQDLYYALR